MLRTCHLIREASLLLSILKMSIIRRSILAVKSVRNNPIGDLIKKQLAISCSLCSKTVVRRNRASKSSIITNVSATETGVASTNDGLPQSLPIAIPPRALLTADDASELKSKDMLKKYPEKVKALSVTLNVSIDKSASLFLKFKFLRISKISTIHSRIVYLLDLGISREELINDLWILTYTVSTIEKRVKLLKELHFPQIKTWLLRCDDKILQSISMNKENDRLAMGSYKTVKEFLKERLELSDAQIWIFASRCPQAMRVKVAKLKEILDFLYNEGFSSHQIYATPRVLCHSLLTLQERLKKLKALNYEPRTLSLLCKNKPFFEKILLNIERETNRS